MTIRFARRALLPAVFGVLLAPALLRASPPVAASSAEAPPLVGVVTDPSGEPLPNARVAIAAAHRSTTTAADGSFALRSVPAGSYHLDVSLLGYAPVHLEVAVPESGPPMRVTVVLQLSPLALEGLNVTASPGGSDPLGITQSTVQLSGKEMDRNLGASVAQTLGSQPGMSVRYSGPAASTPVIRGLAGERILVLQNGQRTGDLASSSPDHGLTLDPLDAERIEVVRGPASLLYGSSALGGVVNVISRDIPTAVPTHLEGFATGQGESVNPGGAVTGGVTVPFGESVAATIQAGFRNVDDVRVGGSGTLDNSYFRNQHGSAGAGYISERLAGGVALGGYRFDYGLPAAPAAEERGVHLEGHREEVKGRADLTLGGGLLSNVRGEGSAQWYTHDEIEESGEVATTFKLRTQTFGLTGRTGFWNVSGALGISGLLRQYEASGEEALTPPADSRNGGVFLYQEIPLGASSDTAGVPRVQLGARYDLYRVESRDGDPEKFGPGRTRDFNQFSASAGLTYPLAPGVSLGASVARAFRAPTVEELFSNAFHAAVGTFDRGNPDLSAETNLGAEGVFRAQTGRVNTQLAAYLNRIDGYIFPRVTGDTTLADGGETSTVALSEFAQADATLRGLEGSVEFAATPRLVVGAMGDLVRGDFVRGGPLPYMPPARIGGSVRWDNGRISAGTELRHAFEQDRVPRDPLTRDPAETAAQPFTLLGVNLGYTLIRAGQVHTITLRVDNLLDEEYRDATSRIKDFALNPGRNVALVYKLLF